MDTERIDPADAPTPIERRKQRLNPPPCTVCGSSRTAVATRTPYVLYIRCTDCAFVCSVPKPGENLLGP